MKPESAEEDRGDPPAENIQAEGGVSGCGSEMTERADVPMEDTQASRQQADSAKTSPSGLRTAVDTKEEATSSSSHSSSEATAQQPNR